MANRFDKYVATEYVGMPVDYYQAALVGKEKKAMDELELQKQQLQAYGQITPVGADAKALQEQILGGIRGRVAGVAKKDLRTQEALSMLHGIVNDPQAIMASRNFMQDVADYTKAEKAYAEHLKDNPNDVNALAYLKAQYNVGQQKGDATKYKPGAFSSIGPFTKYYDWKKRYNEIAAMVKKSGDYKETPIPGDYIQGKGWEGVEEKKVHDAVMQQLSSDTDAMNQIQRELDYNAFQGSPADPSAYFKNVRLGDVRTAKTQFDNVMKIKTDFNDPSMDKQLREEFKQRFIKAGYKVPPKKELDKAYGQYRVQSIQDANNKLTEIQQQVMDIGKMDPRSYTANKFIQGAVQGIAETHSNLVTKETLKGDTSAISAKNRALRLWMHNDKKAQLAQAMAADNTVRVQQDNTMNRGEPVKAWNDPNNFKDTPLADIGDDGKPASEKLPFFEAGRLWTDIKGIFDEDTEKAETARKAAAKEAQTPEGMRARTQKAAAYIEQQFGSVLGPAPVWSNAPQGIQRGATDFNRLSPDMRYQQDMQNYLAAGKKMMGDMKMKGQQVAPMIYHMDALSGSGGRPAPFNRTVAETLGLSEYIYTGESKGNEKKELLSKHNYKVGDKEGLSLKDAIAASNSVSVITDSKFGNPAFRYELQTDKGTQVVYVEQRPDIGGPISKILESYNITANAHQNKPGARMVAINTPTGPQRVLIETKPPSTIGEGGNIVYDQGAAGMKNYVYVDPNHPTLVGYAEQLMTQMKMSRPQFISYVNNAYAQYEAGNASYQLDPATNLITTPNGLKMPPMKFVRTDNAPTNSVQDKYILVAPGAVTIGKNRIGGASQMNVADFERMGIRNAIEDPSMQYYRRFPGSRPKNLNIGSYFDMYDEGDDVYQEESSDNQQLP